MSRLILKELENINSHIVFNNLAYHFLYSFFDNKFILKDNDVDLLDELQIPHSLINIIEKDIKEKEYYRLIYFFLEIKRSDIYNLFYDEDILWSSNYISCDCLFYHTDLQIYDIKEVEELIGAILSKTINEDYFIQSSGSIDYLIKCIKKEFKI